MFGTCLGNFEKYPFLSLPIMLWGNFWKNWATFIPASGHSAHDLVGMNDLSNLNSSLSLNSKPELQRLWSSWPTTCWTTSAPWTSPRTTPTRLTSTKRTRWCISTRARMILVIICAYLPNKVFKFHSSSLPSPFQWEDIVLQICFIILNGACFLKTGHFRHIFHYFRKLFNKVGDDLIRTRVLWKLFKTGRDSGYIW